VFTNHIAILLRAVNFCSMVLREDHVKKRFDNICPRFGISLSINSKRLFLYPLMDVENS